MTHEPIRKALAALDATSILSPERRQALDNFYGECNPEPIAALLADLDRVTRERDEALKDARRYRWLREQHWVEPEATFRLNLSDTEDASQYERELDAAIDAALGDAGV